MNEEEVAIQWLKGTCNYELFKFYMQDIEVAIRMAVAERNKAIKGIIDNDCCLSYDDKRHIRGILEL